MAWLCLIRYGVRLIDWRYHMTLMLSNKIALDTNVIYQRNHLTLMLSNKIAHDTNVIF